MSTDRGGNQLDVITQTIQDAIDERMEEYTTQFDQALEDETRDLVDQKSLSRQLPSEEELKCQCPNKDHHIDPTAYLKVKDAPGLIQQVLEDVGGNATTGEIINAMARGNCDVAEYLFPARTIGPAEPAGDYHKKQRWGNHFETKTCFHIGEATIDAEAPGEIDVVLGKYDGDETFHPVDETVIAVDEGVQRIDLDLRGPESGEYLLTRYGDLPLRRSEYDDIEQESFTDGLKIIGGSKPGDHIKPSPHWYYFFNMEIAAHADAHE